MAGTTILLLLRSEVVTLALTCLTSTKAKYKFCYSIVVIIGQLNKKRTKIETTRNWNLRYRIFIQVFF